MHKKYNKFLIVSFVGVLVLGVYSYLYNDLKSEAASSGDIVSSLDVPAPDANITEGSAKTAEDTAFLMQLVSLNKIKIESALFNEQPFKLLINNNVKLDPVPYGRINPFSPIDKVNTNNKNIFLLKTNGASSISGNSVVLNGSLNGAISNNVYFEYGPSEELGRITPKVTASLVGNFASNVTGLIPRTKYFFRLTANVNGILSLGEIMSFTTN
jgi:hypothetical protein